MTVPQSAVVASRSSSAANRPSPLPSTKAWSRKAKRVRLTTNRAGPVVTLMVSPVSSTVSVSAGAGAFSCASVRTNACFWLGPISVTKSTSTHRMLLSARHHRARTRNWAGTARSEPLEPLTARRNPEISRAWPTRSGTPPLT